MIKILITGGCGFIGSNLARQLVNKNYDVIVMDNLSNGKIDNIKGLNVSFIQKDICDDDYDFNNIDVVVHLAANKDLIKCESNKQNAFINNVIGTNNVIQKCIHYGVSKIVFASSLAIEGNSFYGKTKMVGENLCRYYSKEYGLNYTILRLSNVYGANTGSGVIPIFLSRLIDNKSCVIYGDGEQTRDFVNVVDVCQAIENSFNTHSMICNIGSGKSISINKLIELIGSITGNHPCIEYLPVRDIEIRDSIVDISNAITQIKYIPKISIEQGLSIEYNRIMSLKYNI